MTDGQQRVVGQFALGQCAPLCGAHLHVWRPNCRLRRDGMK